MRRRRTTRSGSTVTGLVLLGLLAGVALCAAPISHRDPFATRGEALRPPDAAHIFGTDDLGRDVFAGVVHGASVSLMVGFAAAGLSALIGIAVGGFAGAGAPDLVLMRITEVAQTLPRFFLVITLVSLFGGRLWFIVAALGLTAWPSTARVFRAQGLTLIERDFVAALGCNLVADGAARWNRD
jgi:peptide/nickel transport system permease protein